MKKQIFRSIFLTTAIIFLASFALILGVLYNYFSTVQMNSLKEETSLVYSAVEKSGMDYITTFDSGDYRITLVASDGTVLYDNKADSTTMENHYWREEFQEALNNGEGEAERYSATLTQRELYYAERLSDGSVLRMSTEHLAWWSLVLSMIQPIILIVVVGILVSLFIASRLSKRIVKPLNHMDLENPDDAETYVELKPLLNRLKSQQRQLHAQEAELSRKQKEFDAATENMREGIILLGENGDVLSINRAASRILKISPYSIGKDLLLFNNTHELEELINEAKNGEPVQKTIAIESKDYQFNLSPVITDEKVAGIALIIFDITEKEKAEKSRREFTANVSHELKTPLQNISGYAELLAGGMVKAEDVGNFSEKIYTEAQRMITLIEDIIKLSHLDEGGEKNDFRETDLYDVAKEVHANLMPVAVGQNVKFDVNGESVVINAVPSLLFEIIYNLCDNAIKYNKDGGSVEVSISKEDEDAVLSVKDTGIGIPLEERERIFERFYRVDKSHSKEVGGTGLGLSIVSHAAAIHGARVEVNETEGGGTTFTIRFPYTLKEVYNEDEE